MSPRLAARIQQVETDPSRETKVCYEPLAPDSRCPDFATVVNPVKKCPRWHQPGPEVAATMNRIAMTP